MRALFRLDNEGKVVPAVAESIANVDPLNWDIKIGAGLTFHNGEPINADAVVFTFERAKKLFAAGKGDLTFALGALKYDSVEKIDDYTVRFVMTQPDPIITAHLVNPGAFDPAAEILYREPAGEGRRSRRSAPAATNSSPTRPAKVWC